MKEITNCGNCGAPVDLARKQCKYCGTWYALGGTTAVRDVVVPRTMGSYLSSSSLPYYGSMVDVRRGETVRFVEEDPDDRGRWIRVP